MCGVFGFISDDGKRPNLERLQRITTGTMRRGSHAFGFAWVDAAGRLKMFKQAGRITDHLGLLAMAADAQVLIGHCRYATAGDPASNINNHPHHADGGWIVHNGVIHDYKAIIRRHGLNPVSQCDSEVLGLLIERPDDETLSLTERCAAAASVCAGGPLVMLGLWAHPTQLIVVRRGNPLHIGHAESGTYLASQVEGLPSDRKPVPDNMLLKFKLRKGSCHATPLPECPIGSDASDEGSAEVRHGGDDGIRALSMHRPAEGLFAESGERAWGF